jgi:hypothetical protein
MSEANVMAKTMNAADAEATVKTRHPDAELETMRGSTIEGEAFTVAELSPQPARDDSLLTAELRLARLRAQVAIVRGLADHIEHFARQADAGELSSQLIEEMARLGCRLFELAAPMTRLPRAEDSGVFVRSRV